MSRRTAGTVVAVAVLAGGVAVAALAPGSNTVTGHGAVGGATGSGAAGPGATRPGATRPGATGSGDPVSAARFRPGAPGVGDPYFPLEGNGGYNVAHYDLDLGYDPSTRQLAGTVRVTARATQNLSRFDLDLSGMHVRRVQVDGRTATIARQGQELRITPPTGIRSGSRFVTTVRYDGSPRTVVGSPIVFGAAYGWQYTKDGAFVGDEPNAAHTWFPCNDHPRDKATFTYRIAVPTGRAVIANGDLVSSRSAGGRTTYVWAERQPMATYLATIDIGRWTFRSGKTPRGIPETVAIDPAFVTQLRDVFVTTGAITDYWATRFGRYPFGSTGAIVDDVPHVGFSLETQTRPLYGFVPDPDTASHELAHQWFGDSVSVHSWRDIWLNEGFATFAQWLWDEHAGQAGTYTTAVDVWRKYPADAPFWAQSIADPQRDTMFSRAVYERGGMTLAALRHKIGDHLFFAILQRWTATHRYGTASTAQFEALAQRMSGQDLRPFFRTWLVAKTKPAAV